MTTRRKTITNIETHEMLTIRRSITPDAPFCSVCIDRVIMVTPEEASGQTGVQQRTLFNLMETGQLHFVEMSNGQLFVCLAALTRLIGS